MSPADDTPAPWHVLIVDDSSDDAELAEIALREGGLKVRCQRVYTADDLAGALVSFAPQLVLCDMNLPGFSGAEALAQVRAHNPALPVILLTGALEAPEPLPQADGLLLKDRLMQLPTLVRPLLAG